MGRVCRVGVWTVAALLQVALAYGQTTATIRGRVRDAQAAPVAAATVTVTGRDTGLTRVVPTADDGSFVVANLPPAVVDLTVSASGLRRGAAAAASSSRSARPSPWTSISRWPACRNRWRSSAGAAVVDTTRSVVDAVIPATAIEALPLNGRNFLELALLVPGNAPAPNFDPTKTNTRRHLVGRPARARRQHHDRRRGQQRRRGRRAAAERHARSRCRSSRSRPTASRPSPAARRRRSSTSSPSRAATQLRGSASLFARDSAWQALPATFDRSTRRRPAVRSPAARRSRSAARSCRAGAFWFGAAEHPQPGRRRAGRRARRGRPARSAATFAAAPLDDLLGSARVDWRPSDARRAHAPLRRRSGPTTPAPAASTARSARRRSASAAATATTRSSAPGRGVVARRSSTRPPCSFSTFDNAHRAGRARAAADVPEHAGRRRRSACRRGPRRRASRSPTPSRSCAARTRIRAGGEWQRVDARVRPRRLPRRPHRVRRGLRRPSITTATAASTTTTCCSR